MTLAMLGIGYAAIGATIAVVGVALRRARIRDAILLVVLWPLAAPLLLTRSELVPLGDEATTRAVHARVRAATLRLAELDVLLERPEFDPEVAARRADELTARGATAAAAAAQRRVRTLGQLHALRERYRAELDEVRELIAQLATQAELVRLAPGSAEPELVRELVARVESLDELFALAADIDGEYPAAPERCA